MTHDSRHTRSTTPETKRRSTSLDFEHVSIPFYERSAFDIYFIARSRDTTSRHLLLTHRNLYSIYLLRFRPWCPVIFPFPSVSQRHEQFSKRAFDLVIFTAFISLCLFPSSCYSVMSYLRGYVRGMGGFTPWMGVSDEPWC